jgi:hypothetical protein
MKMLYFDWMINVWSILATGDYNGNYPSLKRFPAATIHGICAYKAIIMMMNSGFSEI